jgi:hypothetical protein
LGRFPSSKGSRGEVAAEAPKVRYPGRLRIGHRVPKAIEEVFRIKREHLATKEKYTERAVLWKALEVARQEERNSRA